MDILNLLQQAIGPSLESTVDDIGHVVEQMALDPSMIGNDGWAKAGWNTVSDQPLAEEAIIGVYYSNDVPVIDFGRRLLTLLDGRPGATALTYGENRIFTLGLTMMGITKAAARIATLDHHRDELESDVRESGNLKATASMKAELQALVDFKMRHPNLTIGTCGCQRRETAQNAVRRHDRRHHK